MLITHSAYRHACGTTVREVIYLKLCVRFGAKGMFCLSLFLTWAEPPVLKMFLVSKTGTFTAQSYPRSTLADLATCHRITCAAIAEAAPVMCGLLSTAWQPVSPVLATAGRRPVISASKDGCVCVCADQGEGWAKPGAGWGLDLGGSSNRRIQCLIPGPKHPPLA